MRHCQTEAWGGICGNFSLLNQLVELEPIFINLIHDSFTLCSCHSDDDILKNGTTLKYFEAAVTVGTRKKLYFICLIFSF